MALYFYQAFTKDGKKVSGYLDVPTVQAAREQLTKTALFPTKIEPAESKTEHVPFYKRIFRRSISLKDKIFFTKQLAVLLKSGIPILQALDLLVEQTEGDLRSIVIVLRDNLKEGQSLADGLSRYPEIFDTIYIQLVRAGEASGKLDLILVRLTDFLEQREAIKRKITDALRYPLIQLGVIMVVVVGLLTFVVPQITGAFQAEGMVLPLPTRILMGMSNFIIHHYIVLIGSIIAIVLAFRFWKSTASGAYTIDSWKLKLPIVGYFSKTGAIVEFCRTLGMLIEGGVNLAESLSIVVKIVDNKVLTTALEKARDSIIKQGKIAQYLKETNLFPPVAIYLINTGEQSGQLDTMLLTVARYYEDDLKETADNLTSLLNPIMLLVMAVIIGFVILSIMAPITSIMSLAEKAL